MSLLKPLLTLLLFLLSFLCWGQRSKPENDDCHNATPISIGQNIINASNKNATASIEHQAPKTAPASCIQTLENDLWYTFTTENHEFYEVIIISQACNTPAGLQAMLIQSDDCNNTHYLYRACSNKQTLDTLKLFTRNSDTGQKYLIYVDGYDGTVCDFDIWLRGREVIRSLDYRHLQYDYDLPKSGYSDPNGLETEFKNNVAYFSWTGSVEDRVAYYVIERVPDLAEMIEGSEYLQVVGIIDPMNYAGTGEVKYEFEDLISGFEQGKKYRYRIVSVDSDGNRKASEEIIIKANLIEGFFVSVVKPTQANKVFTITYINKEKRQNFYLSVCNEEGEIIKETALIGIREPEGKVTIHMEEFPAGTYYFRMGNGTESFQRTFEVK